MTKTPRSPALRPTAARRSLTWALTLGAAWTGAGMAAAAEDEPDPFAAVASAAAASSAAAAPRDKAPPAAAASAALPASANAALPASTGAASAPTPPLVVTAPAASSAPSIPVAVPANALSSQRAAPSGATEPRDPRELQELREVADTREPRASPPSRRSSPETPRAAASRYRDAPLVASARAANQARPGEPALSCRTVAWQRGAIIRLQAQPYKQIHVELPEKGIDVIMGDKELWALDWINNRIFLKPTSRSSEGRSTTISAIGRSGNAYEFLVSRVPDGDDIPHCVYLQTESGLISHAAWARSSQKDQDDESLAGQVADLRERNQRLEQQTREDLKAYRKKLYSNYAWGKDSFSRWHGGTIESVYDDGRFTYVRIKPGAQGLASIVADIDGKPQMLEYSFDEATLTYQISGVFPKFSLHAGEQTLSVVRRTEGDRS